MGHINYNETHNFQKEKYGNNDVKNNEVSKRKAGDHIKEIQWICYSENPNKSAKYVPYELRKYDMAHPKPSVEIINEDKRLAKEYLCH